LFFGRIGAARGVLLEADGLILVADDRRDAPRMHERDDLVGRGTISDEVPEAEGLSVPAGVDIGENGHECRKVAVNVGEDGERLVESEHHHPPPMLSSSALTIGD
jgi:hypothetical protein